MDSSVLDHLDLSELLSEPAAQKCMDVEFGGTELLNLDESALALAPVALRSSADRAELVRAALRSHQELSVVPCPQPEDVNAGLSLDPRQQLDNNAAASASAAAPVVAALPAPAAMPSPAAAPSVAAVQPPAARSAGASRTVVKSEPVYQQSAYETDSDEVTAHGGKNGTAKRRRRIRNAKQQELNRLAQQRYRERKKQKYSNLQGTVDELSMRLNQLSTLEEANSQLQQRNGQLEIVVKEQQVQLQHQQETISKQAQQLQTQAQQLHHQAQQLQQQVLRIEQQDKQVTELRQKVAAQASSSSSAIQAAAGGAGTDQLNDQLTLAVRAVLTGVSSMTSMLPAKDAQQMQQMVTQLPDALLQQIRSCCREVALHLKKTEVKEQPHAIQVPCC